jgi:hypothetical protein
LSVECVIVRGAPGPALVATADDPNDLLIVGGGRRGRLAGIRVGSVSRYCFGHANCPLLIVPPPAMIGDLRPSRVPWRARTAARVDEPASHVERRWS